MFYSVLSIYPYIHTYIYSLLKNELYNDNPNVTVRLVLRKRFQDIERWIFCTPLSVRVNVSVTLVTR
jgi:hypothetical protein